MNKQIIQIELPNTAFDTRTNMPETMKFRCSNAPLIEELLEETMVAFYADRDQEILADSARIGVHLTEVNELIAWAQRQLSGINVSLWEGAKAQMFRWDTTLDIRCTEAGRCTIRREDGCWKLTHAEYLTPAQFARARDSGELKHLDATARRIGELRQMLYTADHLPALLQSTVAKRNGSIAYDRLHPVNNPVTRKGYKKRIIPKALEVQEDSARLDWLSQHTSCGGALRNFIDEMRANNAHPELTLSGALTCLAKDNLDPISEV